eukprot:1541783-Rhodomonas_salina.1
MGFARRGGAFQAHSTLNGEARRAVVQVQCQSALLANSDTISELYCGYLSTSRCARYLRARSEANVSRKRKDSNLKEGGRTRQE